MTGTSGLEVIRREPLRAFGTPPLLFIHGAYAAAWCWDEFFLPYFAEQGYCSHAVSLRGHGRSAGSQTLDEFGLDDYVADVHAVARTLGSPPVVIGHSMGGAVAQRYSAAYETAGIVLLATVPPHGLMGATMELAWRDPDLLLQFALVQSGHGYLANAERLRGALFASDMPLDRAMQYFSRMQRESQRALLELSNGAAANRAPSGVPVSILGGKEDGLFLPTAVRLTAAWHGTEAAILPRLGHSMMLDCGWRRAADHIAAWLAERFAGERPRVAPSRAARPGRRKQAARR